MTRPAGKYRGLVLVPSTAVLLLMVCGVVVWRLREPVLLDRALKITNVSTWWSDVPSIDTHFMAWTTDTQLFVMGHAKAKGSSGSSVWEYLTDSPRLPFLYDTRNHHRTDLTKLAGQINSRSDSSDNFDVAPDGIHIAWTSSSPGTVDVSMLDGSNRKTWQVSNPTDVVWEQLSLAHGTLMTG